MEKFGLGRVVITERANKKLSSHSLTKFLNRHQKGDWGDCCENDRKINDNALINGERLLSVYTNSADTTFWIITEWDRSVTTILLPEDY